MMVSTKSGAPCHNYVSVDTTSKLILLLGMGSLMAKMEQNCFA